MPSRSSAWSSTITTRTAAPRGSSSRPPGGLSTVSVPSSASTRWRSPVRPAARGSAPPGPSSAISTTQRARASRVSATRAGAPPRVLGDVRQRLGDDEVRGGLDDRRRPARRRARRRSTGIGARSPSASTRRRQPAVGEDRRRDPAGEVAQLGDRGAGLARGPGARARRPRAGRRAAPRRARAACSARRAAPGRRRAGRARCAAARRPGRRARRAACGSARRPGRSAPARGARRQPLAATSRPCSEERGAEHQRRPDRPEPAGARTAPSSKSRSRRPSP